MRTKLSVKVFSAFVGLTALVLMLTLALAQWSFRWGFLEYLNGQERMRLTPVVEGLVDYYTYNDGWENLNTADIEEILETRTRARSGRPRPPPNRLRLPPRRLQGPNVPTALFLPNGEGLAGDIAALNDDYFAFPIVVGNTTVAELRSAPRPLVESQIAMAFSAQQVNTSLLIGGVCLLISMFVAWLLTYVLLKPVKAIQGSVAKLAGGDYGHEIHNTNQDELGQLVDDVNALSHVLKQNRDAKNRWLSNISHELRTPLTVINGEIEAIQSGIRPLSIAALSSIESEALLLKRLIDDLYDLSLSDAGALRYQFVRGDLGQCIAQTLTSAESMLESANLTLEASIGDCEWKFDYNRMKQVVLNIIANSVKYTQGPGAVKVNAEKTKQGILLVFEDTPPGCTNEQCDKLFEPLYRGNTARQRDSEGRSVGLGLAIVKNIVEAHNGKITAEPSALGGLKITIILT